MEVTRQEDTSTKGQRDQQHGLDCGQMRGFGGAGDLAQLQHFQILLDQGRRTQFSQDLQSCSLASLNRPAHVAAPLGRCFRASPVDPGNQGI